MGRRDNFMSNRKYKGDSAAFQNAQRANTTLWGRTFLHFYFSCIGMAIAARLKNENRKSVAVIGDGAMTAGLAFEAMNHAGVTDADMLVIQ